MAGKRWFIGWALIALTTLAVHPAWADEPAGGADEPRELLERQALAVTTSNEDLFLSTFYSGSPEARASLAPVTAFFEMVVEWADFQAKLTKAYGSNAVVEVGMGPTAGFKPLTKDELLARPKATVIDIDGETGTAESLFSKSKLKLIKKDGRWYVDPVDPNPKNTSRNNPIVRAQAMTILNRMAESLKETGALIGQSNQTPATIKAALQKSAQAHKPPAPPPPAQNIGKPSP
jgi:hypothetical protein